MLLGSLTATEPETAYCIILAGQSNNDGSAVSERLLGDFGYEGILTGYPNPRTIQPLYARSPVGVFVYNLQRTDNNLWRADDGVFQAYQATNTGNARNRAVRNADGRYGAELATAVNIQQYTGKEVFILKPAFGATALDRADTGASPPGPWLNEAMQIHEIYIQRMRRDFATFRPGVRLKIVSWHWWQGERDASQGRTQAQYYADLNVLMANIRRQISSNFPINAGQGPLYQFTKLKANVTPAENIISAAQQQYVTANSLDSRFVDVDALTGQNFPKLEDLTVAEAAPLARGNPNNALGYPDDLHASHIYVNAVGEQVFNNILAAGLLIPV